MREPAGRSAHAPQRCGYRRGQRRSFPESVRPAAIGEESISCAPCMAPTSQLMASQTTQTPLLPVIIAQYRR